MALLTSERSPRLVGIVGLSVKSLYDLENNSGGVYVNAPDTELYVTSPLPLAAGLGLRTEISVRAIPLPPLDVKSGPATHLVVARSHFKT